MRRDPGIAAAHIWEVSQYFLRLNRQNVNIFQRRFTQKKQRNLIFNRAAQQDERNYKLK